MEASRDSSSVIRYGHLQYANVGIKADDREDQVNPEYPLGRVLFVPYEMAPIDSTGIEPLGG